MYISVCNIGAEIVYMYVMYIILRSYLDVCMTTISTTPITRVVIPQVSLLITTCRSPH